MNKQKLLPLTLALTLLGCMSGRSAMAAADPHLSAWFANGLSGKTICLVGDSTTSNAVDLISELNNFYRKEGEGLYGVRTILNYGENGASLSAFLADGVVHGITTTISAQADLYVISYGINDVRLGQTTETQLTNLLIAAVNRIVAGVPKASIVLRMPNSFLSADVGGAGFVQPNSYAPAYSTMLRNAYARLRNRWSNVAVLDTQDAVFGRASTPSSPYMLNQVHPSSAGFVALTGSLVDLIGVRPAPDPVQVTNALAQNPTAPYTIYARAVEDTDVFNLVATGRWVASSTLGASNGYLDFSWPANKSADIRCGDIVQVNANHVFALPATCLVVAIGLNSRIYNLGPSLPPYTISGGTVSVWRRWQ
jgi:lysophospholipase L1-like esterase